ncbi:MAG: hypothetical protein OXB99_16175 [Acidimicrobiaceae bacterium]|nr:hypothetical protein [Acidimicrobiaceae bacterium]
MTGVVLDEHAVPDCCCPKKSSFLSTKPHKTGTYAVSEAELVSLHTCARRAYAEDAIGALRDLLYGQTGTGGLDAMVRAHVIPGHEQADSAEDTPPPSAPVLTPCIRCGSTDLKYKRASKVKKALLFTPALLLPKVPHCATCGLPRDGAFI